MLPKNTEQLNAYVDDELNSEDRKAVEAWIAEDPQAFEELKRLKALSSQIKKADAVQQNTDEAWQIFSTKLTSTEPAQQAKSSPVVPFLASLSTIAAALLIGLLLWLAIPQSKSELISNVDSENFIVEMVETEIEDSSSIVYIDPESGWTVVWVESTAPLI